MGIDALRDFDLMRQLLLAEHGQGWRALRWLSMDLRTHRGLLRLAVQNSPDGEGLKEFCLDLKDDKKTVIQDVLKHKPRALRWVSFRLRGDKETVLEAVKRDGRALQWALLSLRADRDVVLAAIQAEAGGGKEVLEFASLKLKKEFECVDVTVLSGEEH